jgi:hypothetical protein
VERYPIRIRILQGEGDRLDRHSSCRRHKFG